MARRLNVVRRNPRVEHIANSGSQIMDTNIASDRFSSQWGSGSTFNIVVACADSETGARALRACDEIVSRLWRDFRFSTGLWKFEDLRKPSAVLAASREATHADMVILSAHADEELPQEVKAWIEQWIANKTEMRRALVALLDNRMDHRHGQSSAERYLEEAARRGDLDFFCNRSHPMPVSPGMLDLAEAEAASGGTHFRNQGLNE